MHKHKILRVVEVDEGQRSIWPRYYGVAQLRHSSWESSKSISKDCSISCFKINITNAYEIIH